MKEVREAVAIDPVRQYLNEIGRHPLLDSAEEREVAYVIRDGVQARETLAMIEEDGAVSEAAIQESIELLKSRAQAGEAAREKMINSNLRLVVSIAKQHQASRMPLLDLIQEGNLGLFTAVDKFDPDLGYKFSTYATWWIRQGITRAIADQSRTIRLPAHVHEQMSSLRRAETELMHQNMEPTPENLAAEMYLPVERVQKLLEARRSSSILELDKPAGVDEDTSLGDFIGAEDKAFESVDERLRMETLGHIALSILADRELTVILGRYHDNMTLEELGGQLGITRERVRQIESKALSKLRHQTLRHPDILRDDHLESLIEKNSGNKRDIRRRYDVSPEVVESIQAQLAQRRGES